METAPVYKTILSHDVYLYSSADSTNLRLKAIAPAAKNGTVCMAETQTAGRGRMDRKWLSKSGTGAWFSYLYKPENVVPACSAPGLVFVAALSVAKVLRTISGANILIKWPNDIVFNSKKLCGIMCEMRACGMDLAYAVLGIGVNLLGNEFPPDLPYAASLESETGVQFSPVDFLTAFLPVFEGDLRAYTTDGLPAILDSIRPISATLSSRVKAVSDGGTFEGIATGFREDGALLIETSSGEMAFMAGDVSVRGIMGYA